MKVNRDESIITFTSTEEMLDALIALSVRVSELGSDESDAVIDDKPYWDAKKLLLSSGFSLQRLLRHELLSTLGEKGPHHIQYKFGRP